MRVTIAEAYRQYAPFISHIPELFARGEGEVVYSQRNEVRRLTCQGVTFIVKRYKRVNVIQQVVYTFFRKTKAERAFRFARTFRERGVDTPREIAFIETTRLRLFSVGYFVCEECLWREAALDLRERADYDRALGRAVMQHVVLMHSKGILHGDLNLTNFLYQNVGGSYRFMMIDTNRSHFCDGQPTVEQCLSNLVRLTHRRDLYEYLIRQYADLRGWDAGLTVARALRLLDRFEHRRRL